MSKPKSKPKLALTPTQAARIQKNRKKKIEFANQVKEALLFLLTRKLDGV